MAKQRVQVQGPTGTPQRRSLSVIADTFVAPAPVVPDNRLAELAQALNIANEGVINIAAQERAKAEADAEAAGVRAALEGQARDRVSKLESKGVIPQGLSPWWQVGYDKVRAKKAATDFSVTAREALDEAGAYTDPEFTSEKAAEILAGLREQSIEGLGEISSVAFDTLNREIAGATSASMNNFLEANRRVRVGAAQERVISATQTDALTILSDLSEGRLAAEEGESTTDAAARILGERVNENYKDLPLSGSQLNAAVVQAFGGAMSRLIREGDFDTLDDMMDVFESMQAGTGPLSQTKTAGQMLDEIARERSYAEQSRLSDDSRARREARNVGWDKLNEMVVKADGAVSKKDITDLALEHNINVNQALDFVDTYRGRADKAASAEEREVLRPRIDSLDKKLNDFEQDTGELERELHELRRVLSPSEAAAFDRKMQFFRKNKDALNNSVAYKEARTSISGFSQESVNAVIKKEQPARDDLGGADYELVPRLTELQVDSDREFTRLINQKLGERAFSSLTGEEQREIIQQSQDELKQFIKDNAPNYVDKIEPRVISKQREEAAQDKAAAASKRLPTIHRIGYNLGQPFVLEGDNAVPEARGKYSVPSGEVLTAAAAELDRAIRRHTTLSKISQRHKTIVDEARKKLEAVQSLQREGVRNRVKRLANVSIKLAELAETHAERFEFAAAVSPSERRKLEKDIEFIQKRAARQMELAKTYRQLFPKDFTPITPTRDLQSFKGKDPSKTFPPLFSSLREAKKATDTFGSEDASSVLDKLQTVTGWSEEDISTFMKNQVRQLRGLEALGLIQSEPDESADDE